MPSSFSSRNVRFAYLYASHIVTDSRQDHIIALDGLLLNANLTIRAGDFGWVSVYCHKWSVIRDDSDWLIIDVNVEVLAYPYD